MLELVGPHGYSHGWIKAGAPGEAPKTVKAAGAPKAAAAGSTLDAYKSWRDNLTPAEDKAMRFYQSPGFALMNGQLRGLDTAALKSGEHASDTDLTRARQASKNLTKAISKSPPLPHDTTVYRGFDAAQFGALTPGKIITDKGFTSVSVNNDAGAVGRAASKAQATITLPAGTRAAAGSVRELVLPPGSSFRVVSAVKRGGVTHVQLELVPKGGAKLANDTEALDMATATKTRRLPVVRGAADIQLSRTGPGQIMARHKSSGMKIGTITPKGRGYAGTHASGKPTGESGSQQGALTGLISFHNSQAAAPAAPAGAKTFTAERASVDLAGSLPFTSNTSSTDGPRVTTMGGAGKPAPASGGAPSGLSPYAAGIYKKLLAKKMKPAVALAMAKRADAMHQKAAS